MPKMKLYSGDVQWFPDQLQETVQNEETVLHDVASATQPFLYPC
jgi:hypothetical protein